MTFDYAHVEVPRFCKPTIHGLALCQFKNKLHIIRISMDKEGIASQCVVTKADS